jgi:hypothetical protein
MGWILNLISMKLTKIKKNLFYLKEKVKKAGVNYKINGKFYSAYAVVLGTKQDAIKKAEKRTKLGYDAIIMFNGKSKVLKDGRSPKKGFKNSYTILS